MNLLGCVTVAVPVDPEEYEGRPKPLKKSWIHFFDVEENEVLVFKNVFQVGDEYEGNKITHVEIRDKNGETYKGNNG